MSNAPIIERVVRPRKLTDSWLPLIVVDEQSHRIFLESTGEVLPMDDLFRVVMGQPSSYVICPNSSRLLAQLNVLMAGVDNWQFRGSPRKREIFSPIGVPTGGVKTSDFIVAFFGFQSEVKNKKGRYHYPIDPMVFLRRGYESLGGGGLESLIRWGMDMRDWCVSNGITPKPTAGGIAGQLLKDPRFYAVARRKVPKATNANARPALPGNHYRLYANEHRTYNAHYLDMGAAHHNAALNISFPHADNLYARGNFHLRGLDMENMTYPDCETWVHPGCKLFENLVTRAHGLLLVRVEAPTMAPGMFPLPCVERPGRRLAWVHTNEIGDLLDSRAIIEGIEAAWVSFKADTGLNKYAVWALDQTAQASAQRKAWLKPVLLSTYGLLATKPRAMEFAYAQAKGGTSRTYPAGGLLIHAQAKTTLTENEMSTASVIHRGMIEAETRLTVLRMARYLHAAGCAVLSVYADSVLVDSSNQLPLLPPPWKNKGHLTNLRFFNATAFTSDEMSKLPGIPLNSMLRTKLIADMRRTRDSAPQKKIFKKGYA